MTAEHPLISAVVARLSEPAINLAAWGIVFAICTIIQSPSTMLLAASTALSKDWNSYQKLHRFTVFIAIALTLLQALLVFSPLYYILAENLLNLPPKVVEPTRLGLMIMIPWSAGTAYRRFQQGVLIRFDHSRVVIWGSGIRVGMDSSALLAAYFIGNIAGIVAASGAIIIGVLSEALYTGLRVQPVLRSRLKPAPSIEPALTRRSFLNFYTPLALTMLLMLLAQPMIGAALSRMPYPLESLAVWPVLFGFLLVWQSTGISYNEAVIALLDQPHAVRSLQRFTWLLVGLVTGLLFIVSVTPAAAFWFYQVAALPPELAALAQQTLRWGLLLPGLRILQSWFQGAITYSRRTRGIIEAVAASLLVTGLALWAGVNWGRLTGVFVGIIAIAAGALVQTLWLWYRGRPALLQIQSRDG